MSLPRTSPTICLTWICILVAFIIGISGPVSCFVMVRSSSPRPATMGRDPVLLECQYRTMGADLVLGVNWYRRQTYDDKFYLIAQVPNQNFVSLPPTFVDKHLGKKANISIQTKGDYQSVELAIWPATCLDEGSYQCEVQVYGGRAPARPTMEVNLNEEPSTPSLSQSPSVLVENFPVTFTCRGTVGRPISRFKWYVYRAGHGSVVEEVEMSGISSLDKNAGTCSPLGSSTLAVMITRADQRVKCVLQQNTKKHILKVEDERQLDVQYGVTDTNVRVKLNSRYQNPEEEVQAVEGDTLLLACNSRGNPEPTFVWSYLPFRGDSHGSHKNGLKHLLDNSDVLITNLTTNHSASYVCVSTNIVRGMKQTETKAVRIVVHERFKAFIGQLKKEESEKKYVLRYVMIGGIVLGAMLFVILLSLVSVIAYRKCVQLEDRNYLVQYHGVKS